MPSVVTNAESGPVGGGGSSEFTRGDAMTVREGSRTEGSGDGRSDREVLSSHPWVEGARWRRTSSVVATALVMLLPVGLVVHGARTSGPSATSGASGHPTPSAGHSLTLGEASLVTLVHRRCPHVRRLSLGDVHALLSVEIAPCSTGRQRGATTRGSHDAVSMRFARIVGVPSMIGGQGSGWIELPCLTGQQTSAGEAERRPAATTHGRGCRARSEQ